jgi:thiol-disulfide isomerase/thioredoxin
MKTLRTLACAILGFGLCLCLGLGSGIGLAAQQAPPPEYAELEAAEGIADLSARIKEIGRIKAAHPKSPIMGTIDSALLGAVSENAATLKDLVAAQGKIINAYKGKEAHRALPLVAMAPYYIVHHEKAADFPKPALLSAVEGYRAKMAKLMADPKALDAIPAEAREAIVGHFRTLVDLSMAKAQLMNGDSKGALSTLEAYGKAGGARDAYFNRLLGDALLDQKRDAEALEAYRSAIIEGDTESMERARAIHVRLNGDAESFDEGMEKRMARLPFHPEEFRVPEDWQGKVVLAELFTGSECPPCVGADLGFDGLIEAYPSKYLAILEYHLPIPRPDPLMCFGSKKRQEYYDIKGTPTVVIDGAKLAPGGGGRQAAEQLHRQYRAEIDGRLGQAPGVAIEGNAYYKDGRVTVSCEFSGTVPGTQKYAVLVQDEEKYMGGNGIVFHKMVVRHFIPLPGMDKMTITFDLADIERRLHEYVTEFEDTNERFKGFKFPVKHNKITRGGLRVVLFVQDQATKQVLNALVAEAAETPEAVEAAEAAEAAKAAKAVGAAAK